MHKKTFFCLFFVGILIFLPAVFVWGQNTSFSKTLRYGSSGSEVTALQTFLKTMPDVYPEGLATGYFGAFTEKAVKLFQAKYGIEQVGFVGPKTRAKLNSLVSSVIPKPMEMAKQQPTVALAEQFATLENELLDGKKKGYYLGPEHSDRVSKNLDELERKGYSRADIQKLRKILFELSPHLQDQEKQKQGAVFDSSGARPLPPANCQSNPNPVFTNDITDISKVNYIGPPPTMGAGPSLKTHSYIGTDHARVPIYAPTAVTLKNGSYSVGGPYMFELQVSCEVTIRFGHVTEPVEAIKRLLPSEPKQDSRSQELAPVRFAAGELLGYTTGTNQAGNWDFGVYNSAARNRYADDPNWSNSATYTTAVCPFAYFSASLRLAYFSKFNSAVLGGNPPHGEPFCKGI